jgi:lycopene beta-cyclase
MHPQSRPKLGHVRRFDFVIAGAGLAGLTLAAALARRFPERTLLLVDPRADRVGLGSPTQTDFDRTIGFWLAGPPPFAELIEHSFARLRVDGPGGARTLELGSYRYHTLRWSKLRDHLLAEVIERPGVTRQHGRVEGFVVDERLLAIVDGEPIAAEHGFDSRLELAHLHRAPGRVLAWQSFCGLHIEVEDPCFDPEQATFMDLRASTREQLRFLNVVPQNARAALVYLVEIGARQHPEHLRTTLETTLREQHGLARFRVRGHEAGVLPLSDQRFARQVGHVRRIGIAGGRLKPSTGYAFTRILADNDAILRSLETSGHPFAGVLEKRGFRLLDGTLLDVLTRAPKLGPELFMGLFARCEPSTVFALLDERASLRQLLAIMTAMPHKRRLALAGLRRALSWLRSPTAVALAPAPTPLALPERHASSEPK